MVFIGDQPGTKDEAMLGDYLYFMAVILGYSRVHDHERVMSALRYQLSAESEA